MTDLTYDTLLQAKNAVVKECHEYQAQLEKLRVAINKHRSQRGDDRCYLDDQELYAAAGFEPAVTTLPAKCEFLASCERFWEQRQDPTCKNQVSGMTIAQLQELVYAYPPSTYAPEGQTYKQLAELQRAQIDQLHDALDRQQKDLEELQEENHKLRVANELLHKTLVEELK